MVGFQLSSPVFILKKLSWIEYIREEGVSAILLEIVKTPNCYRCCGKSWPILSIILGRTFRLFICGLVYVEWQMMIWALTHSQILDSVLFQTTVEKFTELSVMTALYAQTVGFLRTRRTAHLYLHPKCYVDRFKICKKIKSIS